MLDRNVQIAKLCAIQYSMVTSSQVFTVRVTKYFNSLILSIVSAVFTMYNVVNYDIVCYV